MYLLMPSDSRAARSAFSIALFGCAGSTLICPPPHPTRSQQENTVAGVGIAGGVSALCGQEHARAGGATARAVALNLSSGAVAKASQTEDAAILVYFPAREGAWITWGAAVVSEGVRG